LKQVTTGARLSLKGVGHRFGETRVVNAIDLEIDPGEFVTLLGPSGCGKSTLLRILAGLLKQSDGQVCINEQDVTGLSPAERGVGIVFQNYALFPHMTVQANVAYGLQAQRLGDRQAIEQTVEKMLATVKLSEFAKRYPRELSGGQQQRVALARTLAVNPRILLLDEPLGALDKNLRLDMQIEIRRLQRELNITTIMVTHDQEEALSMSDRVAVLNAGKLEQFDTPTTIYDRPASAFVATFVGTANLLEAKLFKHNDSFVAQPKVGGTLKLSDPKPCAQPGPVVLAIRPEQWVMVDDQAKESALVATVQLVMPLGPALVIDLLLQDGTSIKLSMPRAQAVSLEHGMVVNLSLREGAQPAVFASA
jgi:putative spermidine/putrescine transport system ATP-binding protein